MVKHALCGRGLFYYCLGFWEVHFVCSCCHVEDYCRPVCEKSNGNLQVHTIVYYLMSVVSAVIAACYPLHISQLCESTEGHLASNLNSFLPTEGGLQQLKASRFNFEVPKGGMQS